MNKKIFYFSIVIAVLARLLPHPPNVTPFTSLSILSGRLLPLRFALFNTLIALFISDIALVALYHYPLFGSWMWFTYSGFAVIVLTSCYLRRYFTLFAKEGQPRVAWAGRFFLYLYFYAICATLFYWTWTNFGIWLCSDMYDHNLSGLLQCYIAAIPFLIYSMLGDLVWLTILLGGLRFFKKECHHQNHFVVHG